MAGRLFTYPFRYVPAPEIAAAAESLISQLETIRTGGSGELPCDSPVKNLTREEAESLACGKMLGVLSTDKGFLYAFSGLAAGRSVLPGFVPPVFDLTSPEGYFKRREAEISAMPAGDEKSRASAELQDWLFSRYMVRNAMGEELSIRDIFARRRLVPPGGTGDCAAPKLLQYAYLHSMRPLAMGEFWYGRTPESEVREQGRFYPSCFGKCGPLLSFMMEGLDVEPDPLDREYCGQDPAILYSDEHIILADKPSGMLSVPGRTRSRSLLEWLQDRFGEVHSCHRLDMDTSGVMIFARSLDAKRELERQFAERTVEKTYRARLEAGTAPFLHARRGTIALPLSPDYYDRPRQIVDRQNGKLAVTEYEVIGKLPNGETDILFRPRTGRTHQLRVHAAHPDGLGHPIKGDRLYGSPYGNRLYLRAVSISFLHPASGERMVMDFRQE